MPRTTFSFRLLPPLYGLHGAEFDVPADLGFPHATLRISLVDSGIPTDAYFRSDEGGGAGIHGDNTGLLHNTRMDISTDGSVRDFSREVAVPLAAITNRVIDWYRLEVPAATVRKIPWLTGCQATDDAGGEWTLMNPLCAQPGHPSPTAATLDIALRDRIALKMPRRLPLWTELYLDARAERATGNLSAAVLIANASMETLIQRGFRWVAPEDDVAAAFPAQPDRDASADTPRPWSFWRLLGRINRIIDTGRSTTELSNLASRVHAQRDDVSHGNEVDLTPESVDHALQALGELGSVLDPAIVTYIESHRIEARRVAGDAPLT